MVSSSNACEERSSCLEASASLVITGMRLFFLISFNKGLLSFAEAENTGIGNALWCMMDVEDDME